MPNSKGGRVSHATGLLASLMVIGLLWSVTPLSYIYVGWTLLAAMKWGPRNFLFGGPLTIRHTLHFLILAYAACAEIPFSLYYRYLARRANARWAPSASQASDRAHIRDIFRQCLESGLDVERDEVDPISALVSGEDPGVPLDGTEEGLRRRIAATPSQNDTTPRPLSAHLDENDPRAVDFQKHLAGWFYPHSFSDIRRDNILEWLCWSLYGQITRQTPGKVLMLIVMLLGEPIEELAVASKLARSHDTNIEDHASDKLDLVDQGLVLLEARVGRKFPPGKNTKIRAIRLTLDPVKVLSRPLLLYLFVFGLQKLAVFRARGFKEYRDGNTRYLLRIPEGWIPDSNSESTRPLLFIHGLGIGVGQYGPLLKYLSEAPDLSQRPIAVLIQPHISMSFFDRAYLKPPTQESCTRGIWRMCERWGFDQSKLTVLSHSNGSIVHGWICKAFPDIVARSCFVDPVCFCLWEGSVCINFLYKHARTPFDFLMRYFVSTELGVALVMQRSFEWSSNLLFPTQIPNVRSKYHVAFMLAGADVILDAERVRKYLTQNGVEEDFVAGRGGVYLHPGQKHGGSLIQRGVMDWIGRDVEIRG
ncbi:hypothetical protein P7C70_g3102, partial [Phenoliferia sp. Uapishka_3]